MKYDNFVTCMQRLKNCLQIDKIMEMKLSNYLYFMGLEMVYILVCNEYFGLHVWGNILRLDCCQTDISKSLKMR